MEIFPQILISGASGLVGTALQNYFATEGLACATLVRGTPRPESSEFHWDPYRFRFRDEMRRLNGIRAAIHLAGENLSSGRWTADKKRRLRESRIHSTMSLVEMLQRLERPPEVLVCASATGYYGDCGDQIVDESSASGEGFLAKLCREWEAAAEAATKFGMRVVHLRFGVILAAQGGALPKMLPLFRLGLGGRLGSGKQWMSWISLPDVVRIVDYCVNQPELRGPVNVVANPVTNAEFTVCLASHLHRIAINPVPAFALRLALGEMADAALLSSMRAIPARLLQNGFIFDHPTLPEAFNAILPN